MLNGYSSISHGKGMYHDVPNPTSAPSSQDGSPSRVAEPAAEHHSVDVEAPQDRQLSVTVDVCSLR